VYRVYFQDVLKNDALDALEEMPVDRLGILPLFERQLEL
jgi:hypothetical protein